MRSTCIIKCEFATQALQLVTALLFVGMMGCVDRAKQTSSKPLIYVECKLDAFLDDLVHRISTKMIYEDSTVGAILLEEDNMYKYSAFYDSALSKIYTFRLVFESGESFLINTYYYNQENVHEEKIQELLNRRSLMAKGCFVVAGCSRQMVQIEYENCPYYEAEAMRFLEKLLRDYGEITELLLCSFESPCRRIKINGFWLHHYLDGI